MLIKLPSMIPKTIVAYATSALAIAVLAALSFHMSQALAVDNGSPPAQGDNNNNNSTATTTPAAQTRAHLANGTFTLIAGEEKVIPLNTTNSGSSSSSTPRFVVGTAVVEGGMVSIGVTDSNGHSHSADGMTKVAIYPKDYPWAAYEGDSKAVQIPIAPGMEQLVFSAPTSQNATITFDLDVTSGSQGGGEGGG